MFITRRCLCYFLNQATMAQVQEIKYLTRLLNKLLRKVTGIEICVLRLINSSHLINQLRLQAPIPVHNVNMASCRSFFKTLERTFRQITADSCLISGGWLLVSNVVIGGSSTFQLSLETSYRGISSFDNNKTFLTANAMLELRTHLSFTQMRFHCSKQQSRTFSLQCFLATSKRKVG